MDESHTVSACCFDLESEVTTKPRLADTTVPQLVPSRLEAQTVQVRYCELIEISDALAYDVTLDHIVRGETQLIEKPSLSLRKPFRMAVGDGDWRSAAGDGPHVLPSATTRRSRMTGRSKRSISTP